MRIITGTARGRKLFSPEGMDVRPTTDKVKESLFNIVQFEIEGRKVLDLFAGSGQLGLEALSRGAAYAVFVDSSKKSLETVKKNISITGFDGISKTVLSDAYTYLSVSPEKFDIVFMDPPYNNQMCDKAFISLPRVLKNTSTVICETRAEEDLPDAFADFSVSKIYKYSAIKLTVYRNNNVSED